MGGASIFVKNLTPPPPPLCASMTLSTFQCLFLMIVVILSTGSVQVDMMRQTGMFRLAQMNDADAVALDLPYKGQKLSLTIILPKQEDGLKHLEKRFFLFYIKLEFGYTNKAYKSNFLLSCCRSKLVKKIFLKQCFFPVLY